MSLTAGDGSGLRLRSIVGTVVIEDPLAFTELRLTFDNPQPRRREGRFEMDLPPSAALSRLAMRIGRRWMEGEVVERTRGRKTFETFIHKRPRVDPALMEKAAANRVSARIFPIQPHERKEIILSYSQPLTGGGGAIRLPLQGLPRLDALELRVIVKSADPAVRDRFPTASQRTVEISERDFAPTQDLVVALDGAGDAAAVRADDLVAIRVRPSVPKSDSAQALQDLTILFDTSGSSAYGFDREVDRLAEFLETLAEIHVRVVAFDQTVEVIHDGPARDALGDALAGLRERRAFGAADLHAALRHAAVTDAPARRLLLWTDGVATAGPTDARALSEAVAAVPVDRVDAYLPSTAADRETLAALVVRGSTTGFIVGPDLRGQLLATALTQRGFDDVSLAVAGASWSYPTSLESFAPGDDVVIYAQFAEGAPSEVRLTFSDPRLGEHIVPVLDGAAPLVSRAVGRARIAELQAQLVTRHEDTDVEATRAQMTKLAIEHRVLTEQTALIVLESEREYRRYGIDRTARADILTIGATGIELLRRGAGPTGRVVPATDDLLATALAPRRGRGAFAETISRSGILYGMKGPSLGSRGGLTGSEVGEASGALGLGLVGYGRGWPRAQGPRARVNMGSPDIRGSLDKNVVLRVVRRNLNEMRFCYERAVRRDPTVAGRVSMRFVITPTGAVSRPSIDSGALPSEAVECLVRVARRWSFPTPSGGGSVEVRLPLAFLVAGMPWRPSTASRAPMRMGRRRPRRRPGQPSDGPQWAGSAQSGRFATFQSLIARGRSADARTEAWAWATAEPDNALALVALGEALELGGRRGLAARVYGSIIDLHPQRADMRRAAAARLEALGADARALAIDSYRKALAQRPDQINGHRLLAWALVKQGDYDEAFTILGDALDTAIPSGRFNGVKALLREDLRLVAAAWVAATDEDTAAGSTARARIRAAGVRPATIPSLRLVADWETDATDVDLLVEPIGPGDGRRHADVRTGFGPEAWISRAHKRPVAVSARVRYFDRGAMGYAMGMVSAISHDGQGHLSFRDRPFVLMEATGSVELGRFPGGGSTSAVP